MRFLKQCVVISLTIALLVLLWKPGRPLACETFGEYGLTICAHYEGNAYVNLPNDRRTLYKAETGSFFNTHSPVLLYQRNEGHITLDWSSARLSNLLGFSMRWHVELRPWYDSTYDLPFGQGQFHHYLADQLSTNLNGRMAEYYDPLFREYYVDLRPRHFFIRLGRQIMAWGKSDGVYMLDILNNFNLVNPQVFNEQNIKIPEWAANINWLATPTGTLQAIFIPQWIPTYYNGSQYKGGFPSQGGYAAFTYNSIAYTNNFLNGSYGYKVPSYVNMPSTRLNNWVYAARWSDQLQDVHYSLNYLYTWTTGMQYYPNTGTFLTATASDYHPHRMHVAGGSADYDVNVGNKWVDGTVVRMESAVTTGDVYYDGLVGNPVDVTHWGALLGVDRTILTDYLERPIFFSAQYWQDWVVARNNSCACGAYSNMFDDAGFYGGHSGLRGVYKSISTLFMDKTWLSGDILDTNLSVVYEWQFQDWWLVPQFSYRVTDDTTVGMGFDIFAGGRQSPYGEFTNFSNVFFQFRHNFL